MLKTFFIGEKLMKMPALCNNAIKVKLINVVSSVTFHLWHL